MRLSPQKLNLQTKPSVVSKECVQECSLVDSQRRSVVPLSVFDEGRRRAAYSSANGGCMRWSLSSLCCRLRFYLRFLEQAFFNDPKPRVMLLRCLNDFYL